MKRGKEYEEGRKVEERKKAKKEEFKKRKTVGKMLTWHEQAVVQYGHKVRVCVCVGHLLAYEVKQLACTSSVYMYLKAEKKTVLISNISQALLGKA